MPPAASARYFLPSALLRAFACLAVLALLSACATPVAPNAGSEARNYRAQARGNYKAPGTSEDPWGPYIQEAAKRFDIPDRWIREVMRAESGGNLFVNGDLVTSGAGAMGLMQVMPATYDELRERHEGLGTDPYEPRSNILAGTAYIREMYDMYGTPAFLAAYNAGPKRLDDYLAGSRDLPTETRRYVGKIGPRIADASPQAVSPAQQYAMNALPVNVPPGLRRGRGFGTDEPTQFAQASLPRGNTGGPRDPVQVAQLAEPEPRLVEPTAAPFTIAALAPPPAPPPHSPAARAAAASSNRGGFRLISSAMATPAPRLSSGPIGNWAIQVGAFSNADMARIAAGSAHRHASDSLGSARQQVSGVRQGRATLYRARLVGLSHDAATQACAKLTRNRSSCVVLAPGAQS